MGKIDKGTSKNILYTLVMATVFLVLMMWANSKGTGWAWVVAVLSIPAAWFGMILAGIVLGKLTNGPTLTINIVQDIQYRLGCDLGVCYKVVSKKMLKDKDSYQLVLRLPAKRMAQIKAYCEALPPREAIIDRDGWQSEYHMDGNTFEYCGDNVSRVFQVSEQADIKETISIDFATRTLLYCHEKI